jgi:hypothetical protein
LPARRVPEIVLDPRHSSVLDQQSWYNSRKDLVELSGIDDLGCYPLEITVYAGYSTSSIGQNSWSEWQEKAAKDQNGYWT